MLKHSNNNKFHVEVLYNKILHFSRNKFFYTKIGLKDTFQNRINLIFIHISFLFIKKKKKNNSLYDKFYQEIFDLTFMKIELNMREIGYGDVSVNKNMKFLVKTFYNILLNCEHYSKKNSNSKSIFLLKYLEQNDRQKNNNVDLVSYFDKFNVFCLDLSDDSVLKGDLNFVYKENY